jgi:hypothetical protein
MALPAKKMDISSNIRYQPNAYIVTHRPNNIFSEIPLNIKILKNVLSKRTAKIIIACAVSFIIISMVATFLINLKVSENAFKMANITNTIKQKEEILDANNNVFIKKASPENLLKLAKKYNMVPAKKIQYIDIKKGKILDNVVKKSKLPKTNKKIANNG